MPTSARVKPEQAGALRLRPWGAAAYMRATVSLALRLFTLVLLLGWQALASGVGNLGHFCHKQVETRASECHCPHAAMLAEQDPDGQATLRMDCCEAPHWELPAAVLADASHPVPLLAAPPALPSTAVTVRAPERRHVPAPIAWDTPRGQGPPVFLRTRSLLI